VETRGITGSVALVTGGAQGIGEAVVRLLASHGASVAVVDSNAACAADVAQDVCARGGHAIAAPADVRDTARIEDAMARIERELGAIRILVNAAAILRVGFVTELSEASWNDTLATNLTGVFIVSRAVARLMIPRRSGAIVTISSNAGVVARVGMAAYAASKAATTMFTKCLGLEVARHGIRCNIVSPGSTDTPMQRSLWKGDYGPLNVVAGSPDAYRIGIPLRKIATPAEIANAVLFLASDDASHITMQNLCVDGGASL
jgi:2,3-dihydro-2,3-dihydroxybenzoate dehydrogenase